MTKFFSLISIAAFWIGFAQADQRPANQKSAQPPRVPDHSVIPLSAQVGRLPDGSIITLKTATYGKVHYTGQGNDWSDTYLSESPGAILFTTRRSPIPQTLDEGLFERFFTHATAVDVGGKNLPLKRRSPWIHFGHTPNALWETWEIPNPPRENQAIRLRISFIPVEKRPQSSRLVEFVLSNSSQWRKQSAQKEAAQFNRQLWLNQAVLAAALGGDVSWAQELVKKGADVNTYEAESPEFMSALAYASQNGHIKMVKFLIAHGATANPKKQPRARTPLMSAAGQNHLEIMKILLRHGAKLDAQDSEGYTALMFAVRASHYSPMQLLLHKGANVNLRTVKGEGILEMADPSAPEIVISLKKAGAKP